MVIRRIQWIAVLLAIVILTISVSAAFKTLTVQETDFVNLQPEAIDPDNDRIVYRYSAPLNELGQWQTDYDDAGTYEIEVTATDDVNSVSETVELVVLNKNRAPEVTEQNLVGKENQLLDLKTIIQDPDEDLLEYRFQEPFNSNGEWQTDYNDAGTFVTEFTVSDGQAETKARIGIEILNTNQPPTILSAFSEDSKIIVNEGAKLEYSIEATDYDSDSVTYTWTLDNEMISQEAQDSYDFDYEAAGEYFLAVIVSDDELETKKEWLITVQNTNRQPELDHLPITVNENEKAVFDLPTTDQDGDRLKYTFAAPFNNKGEWQTDYDDAGEYEIMVTADDGELQTEKTIIVTVLNVDRRPTLTVPFELNLNEGEKLAQKIEAHDSDNDPLTFNLKEAPSGMEIKNQTLIWEPGYDVIKRKGGLISDVLNYLRLEQNFLTKDQFPITIEVCGRNLCTESQSELTLYNVNRAPTLPSLPEIEIKETETLNLKVVASDPDGDIVRYYYSEPLGKVSGKWNTHNDDEGQRTVYVTASDGRAATTQATVINVLKNDRQPQLEIEKDKITVNENQEFSFKVSGSDPDNDVLNYTVDYLPPGATFQDQTFTWTPSYDTVMNRTGGWWNDFVSNFAYLNQKYNSEKAVLWLKFVAADETYEVVQPVKITIKNINRAPEIIDYLPSKTITAKINQPIVFHVAARDLDGDRLEYTWDFGLSQNQVKGTDTIERTFVAPGEKKVRVTVDDGREAIAKEWTIQVDANVVYIQPPQVVYVKPANVALSPAPVKCNAEQQETTCPPEFPIENIETYVIES